MQRRSATPSLRRYMRPQRTRNAPASRRTMGATCRSTSWPIDGPKEGVYVQCCHQGLGEGGREKEEAGGGEAAVTVVPVPSGELLACQCSEHFRTPFGGSSAPPPPGGVEGISISRRLAKAAASVRLRLMTAHLALTAASTSCVGASRPRREKRLKSSCLLSASGLPVDPAGPSPSVKSHPDS